VAKCNVILFTDTPGIYEMARGGVYRLASEIRTNEYSVLTIDHCSGLNWEHFVRILKCAAGDETLMVGFSSSWFPYRNKLKSGLNAKSIIDDFDLVKFGTELDPKTDTFYTNSIVYDIAVNGNVKKYVDYIKNINPKIKVVIGGNKAVQYKEEPVDNVFIGFCENQIIDYLNSLSKKTPKRIFNKVIDYDTKAEIGHFNFKKCKTGFVDTDLVSSNDKGTIEFARGCIFNCTFCSYAHKNRKTKDSLKFQETIKQELLENYGKWGLTTYSVVDDTFNDSTEKLILIEEVIKDLPFKPEFHIYCRIDLIASHPEQAELLKKIGVTYVFFGLETWNDNTSKIIKKGNKEKKIRGLEIAKACWGNDVFIETGYVVGLPGDTIESNIEFVEWYKTTGHKLIDAVNQSSYHIFRDTEMEASNLSEIEKDYGKYGYYFKDGDEYNWYNDSQGINSKKEAERIVRYMSDNLAPFYKTYEEHGDLRRFDGYKNINPIPGEPMKHRYERFLNQFYIPELFKILETKIW
jgi:radical SAM superfamily enzyme YgiQ (UPF0313 family)